jgi:uncharacterized membrane protein SpoIIM required for sporulation
MSMTRIHFQRTLAVIIVVTLVVFAAGWGAGAVVGDRWHPRPAVALARPMLEDFFRITRHNYGVALQIVAGASTLCLLSAIVLMWNVFTLGLNLRSLAGGCADAFHLVWLYLPMEFGALVLAATASVGLMIAGGRWLSTGAVSAVRREALALLVAASMLVVAAAVEVVVWHRSAALTGCGWR